MKIKYTPDWISNNLIFYNLCVITCRGLMSSNFLHQIFTNSCFIERFTTYSFGVGQTTNSCLRTSRLRTPWRYSSCRFFLLLSNARVSFPFSLHNNFLLIVDYACPKGKSKVKKVILSPGDSFTFNTNYDDGAT